MAMPEYWSSDQVAKFLKVELNNLRQITHRQTKQHEAMGHKNDKCFHMTVSHTGAGKSWYRADKVRGYDLMRKGQIDSLNAVVRATRDQRKRFG